MLRIGVIGAGEMGQHHIRLYSEMEDAELVGIADVDKDRLKVLSDRYGTEYFLDYNELFKKDLDAVSIAVNHTA